MSDDTPTTAHLGGPCAVGRGITREDDFFDLEWNLPCPELATCPLGIQLVETRQVFLFCKPHGAAIAYLLGFNAATQPPHPDLSRGWICMICGADRGFDQISIARRPPQPGLQGSAAGVPHWRVRYCNDRLDCTIAANSPEPWPARTCTDTGR